MGFKNSSNNFYIMWNTNYNNWPREERFELTPYQFASIMMQYSGFEKQNFRQVQIGEIPNYKSFINIYVFKLSTADIGIGFGIINKEIKFWKFGTINEWMEEQKKQSEMFSNDRT